MVTAESFDACIDDVRARKFNSDWNSEGQGIYGQTKGEIYRWIREAGRGEMKIKQLIRVNQVQRIAEAHGCQRPGKYGTKVRYEKIICYQFMFNI